MYSRLATRLVYELPLVNESFTSLVRFAVYAVGSHAIVGGAVVA